MKIECVTGLKNRNTFKSRFNLFIVLAVWNSAVLGAAGAEPVQIEHKGDYYAVSIDYTSGADARAIGESYGRAIREKVPHFEELWDSYIKEYGVNWLVYKIVMQRVRTLRKQLPERFRDEIDGIASQLSGGTKNRMGDGKVSRDELYMLSLIGDVCRVNQCCAVSVFGDRAADAQTICGRNIDWPDGRKHQLAQLQAVTTFNNGKSSVASVGCIGFQAVATGFNTRGVFAAVLDSSTGARYSLKKRRSYLFDLRESLESSNSIDDIASFMTAPEHKYPFNHLILLADSHTSAVLENNFSGKGDNKRRALRTAESELHPGVQWGIKNAIGAVNCFALKGNTDNHISPLDHAAVRNGAINRDINSPRWQSMRAKLSELGDSVDVDGIKSVISFYHPETGGNIYRGDLYNSFTLQNVVFKPGTLELEVAFRPANGTLPSKPCFKKIETGFKSTAAHNNKAADCILRETSQK